MKPTKEKTIVTMGRNKSTSTKSPSSPIDLCSYHSHHLLRFLKTLLLVGVAISCVIETTGLSYYEGESRHGRNSMITYGSIRHNTSSSEVSSSSFERYDPVEAYHQLRRYYLSNKGKHKEETGHSSGGHHHYSSHNSHPQHQHYNSHRNGLYNGGGGGQTHQQHAVSQGPPSVSSAPFRCYVCLPPNKNSREARDILGMFAPADQAKIADCAEFSQHNSDDYEFTCPSTFGGCILRIHGPNISRACSRYRLNDCKKANGVEFCYCTQPLCNDVKQEPYKWPPKNIPQSHRSVDEDEDDDDEDSRGGSGEAEDSSDASDSSANVRHDSPPPPTHHSSYNNEEESGEVRGPLANFNLDNKPGAVVTGSVLRPTTLGGDGGMDAGDSSPSLTSSLSLLSLLLILLLSR